MPAPSACMRNLQRGAREASAEAHGTSDFTIS